VVVRFDGDDGGRRSWVGLPVVVVVGLTSEKEKVKEKGERKKKGWEESFTKLPPL